MRLTQITLFGFKSFAERTVVKVPEGVVAIVGPNGCGKSNISDGVLWAIGEQSAKTLRADRMEDVIFNGSERRKPMGMAEVALTFSQLDGALSSRFGEFGELTVTRRLFRSGESEYLINKVPCRLKDIRDLLMEAGASFKGHTIIEQGKIDALITASPIERRGLIEEAAGIAKYKLRKAEAGRKLEATEQNLLRIKDIVAEVRRQINALDRQAKKAQAARQLAAELRALELSLCAHRLRALGAQRDAAARRRGDGQQAEARQLAAVSALEAEIEQLRLAELEAHQTLRALEQELAERRAARQRTDERLASLAEQQTVWAAEAGGLRAERSRLDQAVADQQAQVAQQEAALAEHRQALEQQDATLQAQLGRTDAQEAACEQQRMAQEAASRQLFAAMTAVSDAQNRLTLLQARMASMERERERLANERQRAERELGPLDEQRVEAIGQRQELAHRLNALQMDHHAAIAAIEAVRQELAAAEQAKSRQQTALTGATIRLASLEELEASLLRQQTELRDTLTTYGPVAAVELQSLVADLLDVPAPYERAIEAALGEQLQAFVVEDAQIAQSAIAFLKQHTAGRALFLPKQAAVGDVTPAVTDSHLIGPATSLVTPRPGLPPEAVRCLIERLLGRVWVVDTLEHALRLAPMLPAGRLMATLEGDLVLPSGVICGGHPPEAGSGQGHGLLQQRRARQALEAELPQCEAAITELSGQVLAIQEQWDARLAEAQVQREAIQQAHLEQVSRQHALDQLEQGRERLTAQRALLDQEGALLDQEAETARQERRHVDEELARVTAERQTLEQQLAALNIEAIRAGEAREAGQQRLTQLKVEAAGGQQRVEQAAAAVAHLRQLADHLAAQREEKAVRLQWLSAQQERARQEADRCVSEQRDAAAALGSLEERYRAVLSAAEQRQSTLRARQAEEKEHRRLLDQRQAEVAEADRALSELSHQLERIGDYLATVYQITPDGALDEAAPLSSDMGGAAEVSSDSIGDAAGVVAEAEQRIITLKTKRDQLGPINAAAIDEYQELHDRYEFLTKQEADLTQSIDDLRAAIAKINRTTRTLFLETFARLNQQFGELYGRFFEGGQASITLLDEDNPLESGIEIMAQPPGKRLRTIQLLSGGEKALTAIALLMASFLIAPSPFCILDEIDAPLDEENVRRFTTVLKGMVQQTQFLVVTHNKRTMEIADQLYGVTMEEPGISRIIGVRLETAERLAAV
jgi:chromosome segregation protein